MRKDNIVKFFKANTKEFIKEIHIKSNSIKCVSLPKRNKSKIYKDPIFITCESDTFIPLYLTVNLNIKDYEISVEHTHPPSELFWGEDRYKFINKLKSKWIL